MIDPKKLSVPLFVTPVKSKSSQKRQVKRISLEGIEGGRVERFNYRGNGHWSFPEQLDRNSFIGFVYVIRDREEGWFYIGKKQFEGTGKLNKGQESNWPWYISSCKMLAASIKEKGKDYFDFIVLEQYKTKGTLSFAETWSLCHAETPIKGVKSYSTLINKVTWHCNEAISDRHKNRLERVLKGEKFEST